MEMNLFTSGIEISFKFRKIPTRLSSRGNASVISRLSLFDIEPFVSCISSHALLHIGANCLLDLSLELCPAK